MAVIATKRNHVYAYEPQAGDTHVQTLVRTATERYVLGTQPIENYADALAWATAIADQLVGPVTLLPITTAEFLNANRAQFETRTLIGRTHRSGSTHRHGNPVGISIDRHPISYRSWSDRWKV